MCCTSPGSCRRDHLAPMASSSQAAPPPGTVQVPADSNNTPMKRMRSGYINKCGAVSSASPSEKCEQSTSKKARHNDDVDEMATYFGTEALRLDPAFDGERICIACSRASSTAQSFSEPGAEVEWLYDSPRGSWCRDCHSVWRHVAKSCMTLTMYELHICNAWANQIVHYQYLHAYISLRFENVKRINKDMLDARKSMLGMFCNASGIPFGPFVVTPRPQAALSAFSNGFPCMHRSDDGKMSLAMVSLLLERFPKAQQVVCVKPDASRPQQVCHTLATDHNDDVDWVRGEASDGSYGGPTENVGNVEEPPQAEPAPTGPEFAIFTKA